jgi:hypothetical protein
MPRSPFDLVCDVVDGLPEAPHALDNEECRLDYVSAYTATLAAHGWTEAEFDAALCDRLLDPTPAGTGLYRGWATGHG